MIANNNIPTEENKGTTNTSKANHILIKRIKHATRKLDLVTRFPNSKVFNEYAVYCMI